MYINYIFLIRMSEKKKKTCNGSKCFLLFLTLSEQNSKVRLISEISEISEFPYLASRQIGKFGKISLSFRTELNFISNCDLQWLKLFLCFS